MHPTTVILYANDCFINGDERDLLSSTQMIDSIKAKLVVKKASDKGMAAERRIQLVPMEQLAEV